ncbi:MAG: PAS domain S-box protein, partial [Bdellovibrionota bacterium]
MGEQKLRNNTWNNAYCLEDIMGEDDKAGENIFRDLFNSINDPMYLANINQDGSPGRFQDVNEAACRVLGYTREELLKLSPRDINIPSNHGRFSNDFFHELRSNGRMTYESTHLSKLGESIPVEANASVLHYKNQRYYVVIARNISNRKLAEQALKSSEFRYRRIIETMQEGFGEIDLAGRIISTNAHLHQMFGYPQDEMIGLNMIEDLLFPEDWPMMRERQKGRRQGQAGAYDQRFRTKTGGTMWAIVTATPVRNEDGTVCGSFAMMTDITERKRAEEALKISERSLSEAQQLAHIGNWKWTVETDEVQWSKELYRMTGLNPELPPPDYADM